MREMKDSGISWIGMIPKDWKMLRTKNQYRSHKIIAGTDAEKYERLALTLDGVIKRSKEDSTGLQPDSFDGYQILQKGELVFKLIDLENLATSRVGYSPFTGIVSPAYVILHPIQDVNARFGEYYFLSLWQRAIFNSLGDNGVRSNLNSGDLLNIPYPTPSLPEQERIVAFLDAKCTEIDTILEKTRTSIEDYKKLKLSVITEAVAKGIRGERPMKDSGVEWIGEIPVEWSMPQLGWITSKIGSGYTPKGGAEVYVNEGIKFLRSQNVYFEGFSLDDVAYITPEVDEEMSGTRVLKGDILFNITGGSIGRCRFVDENLGPANVNQHVCIVRPAKISTKYLFYFLQSNAGQTQVDILQTGGNREGLSASAFKQFSVPLPAEFEQREIAEYLDEKCATIDSLIASKEDLITELESYKKSIIYEYVTGKKEVL